MRTSNPALQAFEHPEVYRGALAEPQPRTMTYGGTITATAILTGLCASSAVVTFMALRGGTVGNPIPWALGAMLVGIIGGFIIRFNPRTAPFLAPPFALAEGVFVGALSFLIPLYYNQSASTPLDYGIVIQALILTFGILFALLAAFSVGMIRLGSTAVKVITVATAGVMLYYLVGMVMSLIGVTAFPRLGWEGGMLGIGFSLFVVVLASLNLVLDFQTVESGVQNKAPKYMEWYGGYALLVTLVWLYIEVLRLLAKLRR